MPPRVVIPELLDELPADHPDARRSRRDLRGINFLMGNERWIRRAIRSFPDASRRGIVEIGAGDGQLIRGLAKDFPESPLSAYDLAPAPAGLDPGIQWQRGDVFACPAPVGGGVLIANLFLHHFEGDLLRALGKWISGFDVLLINEPDRARLPHLLGGLLHPWINHVTRHDMHVSISAGFSHGEIARGLGLESREWGTRENSTWRGARRVIAWRV